MNNSIKAVVWDLDGTLIHFKIDFLRAREEAFVILRDHGIPENSLSLQNNIIDTFKRAKEYFKSNGLSEQEIETIGKKVDKKVETHTWQ